MSLREQMQRDFDAVLSVKEFAEYITYTPNAGEPIRIPAIVHRATNRLGETTNLIANQPEVSVSRSHVPVVVKDGDKVGVAPNYGEDEETYLVRNIVSQSSFRFRLRLG